MLWSILDVAARRAAPRQGQLQALQRLCCSSSHESQSASASSMGLPLLAGLGAAVAGSLFVDWPQTRAAARPSGSSSQGAAAADRAKNDPLIALMLQENADQDEFRALPLNAPPSPASSSQTSGSEPLALSSAQPDYAAQWKAQRGPNLSAAIKEGPWVTDPELQAALQRRALSENKLRGYLHIKQRAVQQWLDQAQMFHRMGREEFEREMKAVEDEVNTQTNIILYGISDPDARRGYLQAYGCTKWTDEALRVIASHSPLLEIGAGLGHWQAALTARGADVLAFDDYSALPTHDVRSASPGFVGKVAKGGVEAIRQHPRRTLLLCYPGPDDMAVQALQAYRGTTLLYIGESRGGVNATPAFFDALQSGGWSLSKVVEVEPFPEGYERLWVLTRPKPKGWLW